MPITSLPLQNGFYQSQSLPVSSQELLNLYVNVPDTQGITPAQLYSCPGLNELATSGINKVNRGVQVMNGIPYFINGQSLIRFNSDGTIDDLGEIIGEGLVSTADNGTQVCIVVPGSGVGYIYSVAGGLVQITDPDFTANGNAEIVVFIDGYFLFTTNSRTFFISALNDGLNYNALDFGSAESDPDNIKSVHVHRSQVYIMGSETIEIFRNVGGADFPFERTGAVIPKGITAPFSVTEFADSFVWIGAGPQESPRVYILQGNSAVEISTTSIDFILQSTSIDYDQVQVFSYTFRGAMWVGWSGDAGTFVYDNNASMAAGKKVWHQRRSRNLQLKSRWRGTKVVSAYNKLLTGDTEGGSIGEISSDVYTEYGEDIDRAFSLPSLVNNNQPSFHGAIWLMVDGGQGLNSGQGSDPQIAMEYSDDGRVYKNKGARSAGKIGKYNTKVRWSQLGYTENYRIYRFSFRDPVNWSILGVYLDVDVN